MSDNCLWGQIRTYCDSSGISSLFIEAVEVGMIILPFVLQSELQGNLHIQAFFKEQANAFSQMQRGSEDHRLWPKSQPDKLGKMIHKDATSCLVLLG
jgi:hypothetical protein